MPRPSSEAKTVRRISWKRASALTVAAFGLCGCQEHFDRRDTISYAVGDSVALNKQTQTIERWPEASRYDRWSSDGERARLATEKYRKRELKNPVTDEAATGSPATTSAAP